MTILLGKPIPHAEVPSGVPGSLPAAFRTAVPSAGIFSLVQWRTPPLESRLLTPAMVHYNQTDRVLEPRQQVLDAAYQLHPERFVRSAPRPPAVPTEAWINKASPTNMKKLTKSHEHVSQGR